MDEPNQQQNSQNRNVIDQNAVTTNSTQPAPQQPVHKPQKDMLMKTTQALSFVSVLVAIGSLLKQLFSKK